MVSIDKDICIGCGKCVKDCLGNHIKLINKKAVLEEECLQCGHCVAVCPVQAVSIPEYDMADVEVCKVMDVHVDADLMLRTIKFRRSIRSYKSAAIECEKLEKLIQAARYTATAGNRQDCHFVIVQNNLTRLKEIVWDNIDELVSVRDEGLVEELIPFKSFNIRRKKNREDDYLFRNAPVVLYICSQRGWDAGMAAQNIELMAVSQGLGVLYNGYLATISDQNQELKKWLGIEEQLIAACLLVGYPDVDYKRTAPRCDAKVSWY